MSFTAISTGSVTIAFLIYLILTEASLIEKKLLVEQSKDLAQTKQILFNRFLGFFLFFLFPFWIIIFFFNLTPQQLGFSFELSFKTSIIIFSIAVIPVIVNCFAARTEDNLAMYPQIRTKNWNRPLLFISAFTWILYLLGYETMLRGVLFFSCLQEMPLWSAIIINTSIYALIHIPKGMKETIGSIPMGIILCLLTYYTGSIWAAIFIHCSLALSNEWFSIKYNKEIVIK